MEQLSQLLVERLLRFQCAPLIERDLDDYQIVSATNVEIAGIIDEMRFRVLGDELETVLWGHRNGFHHGAMDRVANFLQIRLLLAFKNGNSHQGHGDILLSISCYT